MPNFSSAKEFWCGFGRCSSAFLFLRERWSGWHFAKILDDLRVPLERCIRINSLRNGDLNSDLMIFFWFTAYAPYDDPILIWQCILWPFWSFLSRSYRGCPSSWKFSVTVSVLFPIVPLHTTVESWTPAPTDTVDGTKIPNNHLWCRKPL